MNALTIQCHRPLALLHLDDLIPWHAESPTAACRDAGCNMDLPVEMSLHTAMESLRTLFPSLTVRYSVDAPLHRFPSKHPLEAANWFESVRELDSSNSSNWESPLDPLLHKWANRAVSQESTHFIVTESFIRSVPARSMILQLAVQGCTTVFLAPLRPDDEICRLLAMRPLGMYEDLGFAIRRGTGAAEDPTPDPLLNLMERYVANCRGSRLNTSELDEYQSLKLLQSLRKRGVKFGF